ncbi:MAG: biotin--[acetyl-CoA-carboxylase] ligase [Phycisphaerales bacterium JB059]
MSDLGLTIPIERYDETSSTRELARHAVESGDLGEHPRIYVAAAQSEGRARFGRTWHSPRGGLWLTLAWPVNREPSRVLDGLGIRVGIACVHAIERVLAAHGKGARVELRWPNDVLIDGKRVLATLCEVLKRDGKTYVLASVGINADFSASDLPEPIRPIATTLRDVIGAPVNLERLLESIGAFLQDALQDEGLCEGVLNDARDHLHALGEQVEVTLGDRTVVRGSLEGLSEAGRLILRTDRGRFVAPEGAELHRD